MIERRRFHNRTSLESADKLFVAGRYLNGTTPNMTHLLRYNISDWSLDTSIQYGSEANYAYSIADDSSKVYVGTNVTDYVRTILKSDFSQGSIAANNNNGYRIAVDDNYIYTAFTVYVYVFNKSTGALVTSLVAGDYSLGSIYSLCVDDSYVYAGGAFGQRFTVFRKSDWAEITGTPTFNNRVNAIASDGTYVYIGGQFTGGFKVMNRSTMTLLTTSISIATVNGIAIDNDRVYLTGSFTGTNRSRAAVLSKSDFNTVITNVTGLSTTGIGIDVCDRYLYLATAGSIVVKDKNRLHENVTTITLSGSPEINFIKAVSV